MICCRLRKLASDDVEIHGESCVDNEARTQTEREGEGNKWRGSRFGSTSVCSGGLQFVQQALGRLIGGAKLSPASLLMAEAQGIGNRLPMASAALAEVVGASSPSPSSSSPPMSLSFGLARATQTPPPVGLTLGKALETLPSPSLAGRVARSGRAERRGWSSSRDLSLSPGLCQRRRASS